MQIRALAMPQDTEKYSVVFVEDSLGWQNALIDEASVRFRLTVKGYS